MDSLSPVEQASAGFDPGRTAALQALLEEGAREGLYPGGVYQIVRGRSVVAASAAGLAQEEPATPAGPGTVFDLASLTKPMVTATAILQLAERGAFHLDEELPGLLEDCGPSLAGVTLRRLLTHSSGLPAWKQYHSRGLDREGVLREVRHAERERPIGSRYVYSDLGFMLLGAVVEQVSGKTLAEWAQEHIFAPLGMSATRFLPPPDWRDRLAATRCPDRKRVLLGEVHDGNCDAMGGVAGHAGLFSTAADVGRYATALLSGGALDRARVLSPLAVRLMATNQLPPEVGGASLGWFTPPNGMLPSGDFMPPDCFGHTGFTGTSLLLSRSLDLAVVLLTNRVCQERDAADFLRFRRRFHNVVAAALIAA